MENENIHGSCTVYCILCSKSSSSSNLGSLQVLKSQNSLITCISKLLTVDESYLKNTQKAFTCCNGCIPKIEELYKTTEAYFAAKKNLNDVSKRICRYVMSTTQKNPDTVSHDVTRTENEFDFEEWDKQRFMLLNTEEFNKTIDRDVFQNCLKEIEFYNENDDVTESAKTIRFNLRKRQNANRNDAVDAPKVKKSNVSTLCDTTHTHRVIDSETNEDIYCDKEQNDPVDEYNSNICPMSSHTRCRRTCTKLKRNVNLYMENVQKMVTEDCFKCKDCDKVFSSVHALKSHSRVHVREKKGSDGNYGCTHCNEVFSDTLTLKVHKRVHEDERNSCPICCKILSSVVSLQSHLKCHYSRDVIVTSVDCRLCKKTFESPLTLASHMTVHNGEYSCLIVSCRKGFTSLNSLKHHESFHKTLAQFGCDYCYKSFDNEETLQCHISAHIEDMHKKSFLCQKCGLYFISKLNLQRHLTLSHKDPQHSCMVCQKSFATSQRLKVHMALHNTADAPFSCDKCNLSFAQKVSLDNHNAKEHGGNMAYKCIFCEHIGFSNPRSLRVHLTKLHQDHYLKTKKFLCDVCYKNFMTETEVQAHMSLNHGNLKCKICDRQFKISTHLKEHVLRHSEMSRPFKCQYCPKGFIREKQLNVHILNNHSSGPTSSNTETVESHNVAYVIHIA